MASFRLIALLFTVLVTLTIVYGQDKGIGESIADQGRDLTENAHKAVTESQNLFQAFGEKVEQYYDTAVEKSKEALKATGEAISSSYDKLKEKTKELME